MRELTWGPGNLRGTLEGLNAKPALLQAKGVHNKILKNSSKKH